MKNSPKVLHHVSSFILVTRIIIFHITKIKALNMRALCLFLFYAVNVNFTFHWCDLTKYGKKCDLEKPLMTLHFLHPPHPEQVWQIYPSLSWKKS